MTFLLWIKYFSKLSKINLYLDCLPVHLFYLTQLFSTVGLLLIWRKGKERRDGLKIEIEINDGVQVSRV